MDDAEILLTIAEIGVGFAGFASLVTIVGSRVGRDAPPIQAVRFRGLILIALLVVAFSLFPVGLHRLDIPEPAAFRVSSTLLLISGAGVFLYAWLLIRRGIRSTHRRPPALGARVAGSFLPALVAGSLLARVALDVSGLPAGGAYIAALFLFLFAAGFIFVEMLFSFVTVDYDEPAA